MKKSPIMIKISLVHLYMVEKECMRFKKTLYRQIGMLCTIYNMYPAITLFAEVIINTYTEKHKDSCITTK